MASDRISRVRFHNVRVRVPREKYTGVFPDEGEVGLFAVMKELVRLKYPRMIYPEHPRGPGVDLEVSKPPSQAPACTPAASQSRLRQSPIPGGASLVK